MLHAQKIYTINLCKLKKHLDTSEIIMTISVCFKMKNDVHISLYKFYHMLM